MHVPRTLRSAISAFTRVFDTLWRCAADRGGHLAYILFIHGSRLCRRTAEAALHRVRDTTNPVYPSANVTVSTRPAREVR